MFKPNQTSKTGWRLLSFVHYLTEEGISTAFSKTLSHIITYVPNIMLPNWTNHMNLIRFGHFGILGCDIGQVLPKSTQIVHPVGIVIHKDADIGKNVKLLQNITIGNKQTTDDGVPEIQDNVVLCAGCSIIGDVTVGKILSLVQILL